MTEGKAKLPYWLEGDDRFTIDGRLAIHGTGTEDYFNCGWYALPGRLDRPACYPTHGFPVYRNLGETWQAAAYRWHLADPVPFARSIDAGIEHGGENDVNANYRAAVFWYSDRPGPATGRSLSADTRETARSSSPSGFKEEISMPLSFTVGGARGTFEPSFCRRGSRPARPGVRRRGGVGRNDLGPLW